MQPKQTLRSARRSSLLVLLTILALLGLVWWQRQNIFDQIQLYGYEAPAAIAQLATDTTMNDQARKVYYVNKPELQDRADFKQSCTVKAEQTIVLGCYKSGQRGIFLLKVTNEELRGIQQVTAAHEMLHAAYDRLSGGERERINKLLESYYKQHSNDQAIKQMVEDYEHADQHDLVNEMHSIFGTQIASLPSELNDYYARYFTDRSKVVAYYQSYEQAFSGRREQIKQYDQQLNEWSKELETLSAKIETAGNELKAQQATMDRYQASGQVSTYNAMVGSYNARVRSYNADLERRATLTNDYNELVNKRNDIAFEERSLVESLSAEPM
jgi:hypothetical protein